MSEVGHPELEGVSERKPVGYPSRTPVPSRETTGVYRPRLRSRYPRPLVSTTPVSKDSCGSGFPSVEGPTPVGPRPEVGVSGVPSSVVRSGKDPTETPLGLCCPSDLRGLYFPGGALGREHRLVLSHPVVRSGGTVPTLTGSGEGTYVVGAIQCTGSGPGYTFLPLS